MFEQLYGGKGLFSIFLALILTIGSSVKAAPVDVDPDLITDLNSVSRQGDVIHILFQTDVGPAKMTFNIEKIPKGTLLFHWTKYPHLDWISSGRMSEFDMDQMTPALPPELAGSNRMGGVGWYVSMDPVDSSRYGNYGFVEQTKSDFWVISDEGYGIFPQTSEAFSRIKKEFARLNIVGSKINKTWLTIIDLRAASNIRAINSKIVFDHLASLESDGKAAPALAGKSGQQYIVKLIEKEIPFVGSHPYIEKHLPALNHYLAEEFETETFQADKNSYDVLKNIALTGESPELHLQGGPHSMQCSKLFGL